MKKHHSALCKLGLGALSATILLFVLADSHVASGAGRGGLTRPIILPLDNGSLQNNLPGNVATLPLFLRNGGVWGFGAGAFGQLQANPPSGGVIIPENMNLGNGGGKLGAFNGNFGCY
jgi:hypothetical protein